MKLRRDLIGIALTFLTAGTIATNANAQAYQEVYEEHQVQETQIKKVFESEFISNDDRERLLTGIDRINKAQEQSNRRNIREMLAEEESQLAEVKQHLVANEARVAQSESDKLAEKLKNLEEKSKEPFVLDEDVQQIKEFNDRLVALTQTKKVDPVRAVADEVALFTTKMNLNQSSLIELVEELKGFNQSSAELLKKKYLSKDEKQLLTQDQKVNTLFFEDADNMTHVKEQKEASQKLIESLQQKQAAIQKDFDTNETQVKELVKSVDALLAQGDLISEEKESLTKEKDILNQALKMIDYQPGDLGEKYTLSNKTYHDARKKSDGRIAEAKKKAEEEAAKKAAQEKALREAAAEEAARQQAAAQSQASNHASPPAATVSGGWHQAPAGYKYLKVESGLTYGQVKNPNNFSLITVEEAANYRSGHGNGSAKQ